MKNLKNIAVASLIVLGSYSNISADDSVINVDPDKKPKPTIEQQCENSKMGISYILGAMKHGGVERFSTPWVSLSSHPEERFKQEMRCVEKYVEDETSGTYGISEEKMAKMVWWEYDRSSLEAPIVEKDNPDKIRFIIYKKTDKS
ncbi:MAG: hypothetical protein AABX93_00775 [Nanoarchaeota archaeon]